MKNRKMYHAAIAAVGAMMMCAGAYAQTTSTTTTTTTQNGSTSTTVVSTDPGSRLSVGDQILIMNLIEANAKEIELSRLALHQAWSKGVSDYAQMMINDHTALQNQLMNSYGNQPWMYNWQNTLKKSYDTNGYGRMGYNWYNTGYGSMTTTNGMSNMNQTSGTTQPGQTAMNNNVSGSWDNWMYLNSTDWDIYHHLDTLQGFPFDKEYIHQMVMDHRQLMEKLWAAQGNTSNSDVTALVPNVQQTVQNHLEEGRRISFNYDDPFHLQRTEPFLH
jgi:predicted outer membrane protein